MTTFNASVSDTKSDAERSREACILGVQRGDTVWRLVLLGVPHRVVSTLEDSEFDILLLEDLLSLNWTQVHSIPGLTDGDHDKLYDALLHYDKVAAIIEAINEGIRNHAPARDLELLGATPKTMNLLEKSHLKIETLEELDHTPPRRMLEVKHVGDKQVAQVMRALSRYPQLPQAIADRELFVYDQVRDTTYDLCPERAHLWELQNPRPKRKPAVPRAAAQG